MFKICEDEPDPAEREHDSNLIVYLKVNLKISNKIS